MTKGFVFNSGRCVSCAACSAACNLYNRWETRPRNVYIYNSRLVPGFPVLNLSLACNHCEKAACIEGCPSGALSRNALNGAVVVNESECLGCRYCQWNCPFDAPKYDNGKRVIEKCDLCCNSPEMPSCASACPTGALKFTDISESDGDNLPEWLPGKKLKPSLQFTGSLPGPTEIIPSEIFTQKIQKQSEESPGGEWSLVMFSFISMIMVAVQVSSFMEGTFNGICFFMLLPAAGLVSLFHLGRPLRAWRALANPVSSPLSREICCYILFSSLSVPAAVLRSPEFSLAASVAGMLLLMIIDSVYVRSSGKAFFHSGQTFTGGLLLISYFTDSLLPFTFIVIIKVLLSAVKLTENNLRAWRYLRIAVLTILWAGLVSGLAEKNNAVTFLVIFAEFIDRVLFYKDFQPGNIKMVTDKNINDPNYEKKRG